MTHPAADHVPGLIPGLPDDVAVRCIARVPLAHHPSLCHVSQSWRSLLRSPLLSAVRSALRSAEPVLLLNLRGPTDQSRWLLLLPLPGRRAPPRPLPPPPLPSLGSTCAALGPSLYLLGGSVNGVPTAGVQILDPARDLWAPGPRMRAAREFAAAAALGGRIYVLGGCPPGSEAWAEALDPGTGLWAPVPSPASVRERWMHGSAVLSGRIMAVADRGGVAYEPGTGQWGPVPAALDMGWRGRATMVGEILYSYDYLGKIRGYDPEADQWRRVEGLEKELPRFLCGATLADLGGVLCVVWEGEGRRRERGKDKMVIEIAGIDISRTSDGGLRGSILWWETVILNAPCRSLIAHCVSLEL